MKALLKMNKKAQSQVITTVLIILLVLAAIIIVWQIVNRTVGQSAEEIETRTSCVSINVDVIDIINTENDIEESVTIRRGTGAPEIKGAIGVLYINGAENQTGYIELAQLESETFNIQGLKKGDVLQVAAKLPDGRACMLSHEVKVPAPSFLS